MSGLCVKTLGAGGGGGTAIGEATSMCLSGDGRLVLTSSRHGPVRLWDLRSASKPLVRYTGHQNSGSSFVRCAFGAREGVVLSGSDDGTVRVWETASGEALGVLGHGGSPTHRAVWCGRQGLLASCADDGSVKTWCYKGRKRLPWEAGSGAEGGGRRAPDASDTRSQERPAGAAAARTTP